MILTHYNNPVKGESEKDVTSLLFTIESFVNQKYETALLPQNIIAILDLYLYEWMLEFFKGGLGISDPRKTYRRQIVLKNLEGGRGKSTLARILRIQLWIRNYVSLDSFPTEKRANSMIYFLF